MPPAARWLARLALVVAPAAGAAQPAATGASPPGRCDAADVRTAAALAAETARLEKLARPTVAERCRLAALALRAGRVERADTLLRALAREVPRDAEVLLALARLDRRTQRHDEADRWLRAAAAIRPRDAAVRLHQADVAAAAFDVDGADSLYRAALVLDPASARAALGLARVAYLRDQPDSALARLDALLRRDSLDAAALLLRASVHREQQRTQPWKDATRRALAVDSLSAEAHAAMATLRRDEGDLQGAYREALAALALDPYSEAAHGYLGNGGSVTSYGKYPPLADDSVPPALAARLDSAAALLAARRFAPAESAYRALLAERPALAAAMLGVGAARYRQRDYPASLEWYRRAAAAYPDLGLAHYGVVQSIKGLKDARNPRLQAALARFRALPRPPEPARLREVFPDFDHVDADIQKVILLSAAPVSRYVPLLATAGATFELIPFEKRMWEVPGRERTRGTRTFDLRLWDDVKGQGGFRALSGEEWVRDATVGRYNVLSHEFLHQVHGTVFSDAQRAEVRRLFTEAKRERRTLDYYADFNEMEYLAQAYEAVLSETKPPDQRGTSRNTRPRLERLDPGVYRFLLGLNALDSYRDNEAVAHRQRVQSLLGEGKLAEALAATEAATAALGERPELLVQVGTIRVYQGDYRGAIAAHERAVERFPDDVGGYAALADDHVLGARDYPAALAVLRRFVERQPRSGEGWMRLASMALAAGRLDEAREAIARADSLIGAPNPYAGYAAPASAAARRALLAGDHATAEPLLRASLERVNRNDLGAWTDLGAIALARGDSAAARASLATAQSIDRRDARVRQLEARLLALDGKRGEARAILAALLAEDTTRVESYAALVAQLRDDDPEGAAAYAERGLRLVEARAPVRYAFEGGRYRQRGGMTMPAVAELYTEAALVAERRGDAATAVARHRAAVAAFPHAYRSLVGLVRLAARAGDRAGAATWARELDARGAPSTYVSEARALLGEAPGAPSQRGR